MKGKSLSCTRVAALLLVFCCLALPLAPASAQETPTPTPGAGLPSNQQGDQPGERLFESPLVMPTPEVAASTETPTLLPTEIPTATPSPTPTGTPVPTTTPTATSTATIAPLQVSPLVAQGGTRLPDDGARLWIGAAALIILAGSAVLLVAERRQNR